MQPYLRKPPSSTPEKTFTLSIFGGGLNNVSGDITIADNQATDCKNMSFVSDEIMEKRCGITAVDDEVLNAPITWMDLYKPKKGDSKFIRATDAEMWIEDGATIKKLCDVEGSISGVNYIGKYYFVDGKSIRIYDGETVYKVCNTSSYITEEVTASGVDVKIKNIPDYLTSANKFTFYKPDGSIVTLNIQSIDRVNSTIKLTTANGTAILKETVVYFYIPLATTELEGVEVWDKPNGFAYYEPCANQLLDDFAGTPYIPDSPDVITVHKDRLFISGDSESPHSVHLSAQAAISPLYFPSKAGLSAKPDGGKVVGLVVFDDALVICRNLDMFVIYGNSEYHNMSANIPFSVKQIDASIGFMSKNCYGIMNNFMFYLGYDGRFYKMNTPQTYVNYLMTKPLSDVVDVFKKPLGVSKEGVKKLSSTIHDGEFIVNIEGITVVYSYRNQAFTYYEGWNGTSLYSNGLDLYIGRSDGKVAIEDKTKYSDLGVAICAVYETKRFDLSSPVNFKYFKQCLLTTYAPEEEVSEIKLEYEVDYFYITTPKLIRSTQSLFGVSDWGDRFSDKDIIKSDWYMLNSRGRTIKFKISNNILNQPMRVYDINLIWSARDVR